MCRPYGSRIGMGLQMRELLVGYGWAMLPLGAIVGFALLLARRNARRVRAERRGRRRQRNIAHRRAWDWLMGRARLRITHAPEE
ncbi:hypothetical protein OK349_09525 [Sphingomonas sp. BT-65]|uniref:hypothetical protein n=1 Tax=Sphingomonas sp. BT-65 TaxID=2989821 RepID=UPI0022363F15|nr:hypothetical protein [Sphingomonas sp. BT-65]MCW4461946.1 hypothetical protein [Sphingomonas sp. BT-65]